MVLIKKTGWIKPFLTLKKKSIEGAVSLSIQTVKTRRRTPGRVVGNTSISYKLNFEMPGKKLHINTFTEKTKANAFANEVAQLLEIESVKPRQNEKGVRMIRKTPTTMCLIEGLGTGAYIFGGIILFFAAIFLFIEMHTAMLICLYLHYF